MALTLLLKEQRDTPYAAAFDDVREEEIIRAMGRASATNGDPKQTYSWASKIGSAEKVASDNDLDATTNVERRIFALVGLAEGMLDQRGVPSAADE